MTTGVNLNKVAVIAAGIEHADRTFESSIRMTRLVDEEVTYTATCTGSEDPRDFTGFDGEGYQLASQHVVAMRSLHRAEEVLRRLEALASPGSVQA